ncbi:hypothetical protein [Nocardiopsis ansamitocini]|nr:hypothetical protein [Nocardiopsis ansamitocini]
MAQPTESGTRSTGRQWAVMGVALAVVVLLVGGALAVNTILPGTKPVPVGAEVVLEEDAQRRISLTLAEGGWVRDFDAERFTNEAQLFVRGPLRLQVVPVTLAGGTTADAARLWKGMGDILRTKAPGTRLATPSPITSDQGVEGLTGAVRGGGHEAVAVLYPAPDGEAAVQMLLSAQEHSTDVEEVLGAASRSVVFADKKEDA